MTSTHRLIVRGLAVTTRTPRRFVVVAVRPEPVTLDDGVYVAFAEVQLRTDALASAKARARRYGVGRRDRSFAVVVDTATGEEV